MYGIADECALLVATPEEGFIPSLEKLFGGVRRFPTLAIVVEACDDCGALMVLKDAYLLCTEGGGSSKLPNWAACGLRAVKLGGAPIGSDPGCMEAIGATAAATFAVVSGVDLNGLPDSNRRELGIDGSCDAANGGVEYCTPVNTVHVRTAEDAPRVVGSL